MVKKAINKRGVLMRIWALFAALGVLFAPTVSLAQESTSESELRASVEALQRNDPDYDDMEPSVRIAVREQISKIAPWLRSLGAIESVQFEETSNGVDIYLVRFTNGRTIWHFARSPSGKIAVLYFQAF